MAEDLTASVPVASSRGSSMTALMRSIAPMAWRTVVTALKMVHSGTDAMNMYSTNETRTPTEKSTEATHAPPTPNTGRKQHCTTSPTTGLITTTNTTVPTTTP